MTVATLSNPPKRSMWLLLLVVSSSLAQREYTSIYVPVGVGQPQKDRNMTAPFGGFGDKFNLCGKHTSDGLNPEFKKAGVSSSIDYAVVCNPSPIRVIVSVDGKPFDFGAFKRDLKKECELLTCSASGYEAEGTALGPIKNQANGSKVLATKPENKNFNVCSDKKAAYSNGPSGNVLFANEDNCRVEHPDLEAKVANSKSFVQLPRWIQKNQEKFNLNTLFYKGSKVNHLERVKYGGVKPVDTKNGAKYQICNTACDRSQLVKLNMKQGSYKIMIYLNAKCPNFRICLNPNGFLDDTKIPECNPQLMINVMVHNGVVVFATKGRASLIEMKADNHQDTHPVAIEFGYGHRTSSGLLSEFYVANDHREFVTSDTDGFRQEDADKLAFFFPTADCLFKTAGIFSEFITTGKAYTSETVKVVGGIDKSQDGGQTITGPQNNSVTPEPTLEPIYDFPKTTTAAPLVVAPGVVDLGLLDSSNKSAATYVKGKWWIWGLYFGFLSGTFLTLLLGGATFYLTRRTVFGIWYRGMYKRYGCDASGTTGGITGVGYGTTVTGTQTVGDTTAAGNTVVGGKTSASATTGTTTGATEATSTTSMLDKTDTLAM